jgi:hypothetical protein
MDPGQYNRQLQRQFDATRRVPRAQPTAVEHAAAADLMRLEELHASGVLTDSEFAAAKVKLLDQ